MANCSNCIYFNAWYGYCTINKGDSTPHSTCFRYSPKAYKFRLYPNEEQKILFAKTFGSSQMFYIRFGEIPKDERSSIHYRGMYCGKEEGVSVYDCTFIHGEYHIVVPCPVTMGGLDTLTDFLFYDADKPVYFVEGEQVGTGHDGEPLIHNVKIIADITDRFRGIQSSIDGDKLHNELLSLGDKFEDTGLAQSITSNERD